MIKFVAFCKHSGEDQISHDYLILLDQRCDKYLNNVCSEDHYCTLVMGENEKVDTIKNLLLTYVKSIMKEYY